MAQTHPRQLQRRPGYPATLPPRPHRTRYLEQHLLRQRRRIQVYVLKDQRPPDSIPLLFSRSQPAILCPLQRRWQMESWCRLYQRNGPQTRSHHGGQHALPRTLRDRAYGLYLE